MSAEKRPAADSFGTNQLVKRQRSDANINGSSVAVVNESAQNGAIIQSVRAILLLHEEHFIRTYGAKEHGIRLCGSNEHGTVWLMMVGGTGTQDERATGSCYGVDR